MDLPAPHAVRDGLACYRLGTGRPVLLVPGPHRYQQPGDGSSRPLVEGLTRLGRQVVSFDPPGSGASTRPADVSLEEMLGCAVESLRACGAGGPVDVFGHSMAGLVALAFALEHPERVRRLVLVGTGSGGPAYVGVPGALWHRSHPAFRRMALLGAAHLVLPVRALEKRMMNLVRRESFVDRRLAEDEPLSPGDWLVRKRGHGEWHRIARRLDLAPRLGEITAPTLVLCGQRDPQFPPSASRALATALPDARLVLFDRSGHYPFLEEPEAFWDEVGAFLG